MLCTLNLIFRATQGASQCLWAQAWQSFCDLPLNLWLSSGLLARGCFFFPCNPSNPKVKITNTCGCRMPMQSRVQRSSLFIAHTLQLHFERHSVLEVGYWYNVRVAVGLIDNAVFSYWPRNILIPIKTDVKSWDFFLRRTLQEHAFPTILMRFTI